MNIMTKAPLSINQPVRYRYMFSPIGFVKSINKRTKQVLIVVNDGHYTFTKWVHRNSIDPFVSQKLLNTRYPNL